MIKIEHAEVVGWEHVIRGMRNPMNSWDKSDSGYGTDCLLCNREKYCTSNDGCDKGIMFGIGPDDHELMMKLAKGGPVHAKYRRMITVYLDITAPLYWWKEFDTYKIGTVANRCSTMHKIHAKEFELDDFSHEHLDGIALDTMKQVMGVLNTARSWYMDRVMNDKALWWQMIQLLPSSYNQKSTIMLNYEVLAGIYKHRKDHKLDEWREFCKWIEGLPHGEVITCDACL